MFLSDADTDPIDSKLVLMQETNTLPTHVYCIVAGPYAYHERRVVGHPRMRIYARPELIDTINYQEMFDVVVSGHSFYGYFFGVRYPFSKYDQVFTPEANYKASESVGCLTTGTIEGNESEYVHANSPPTQPMTFNEHYIFSKDCNMAKR